MTPGHQSEYSGPSGSGKRAVSRFLTAADEARSLHHLMFANSRTEFADAEIEPLARRRFDFQCGQCGMLHHARVWDIAAQRRCRRCRTLMIIPAPIHSARGPLPSQAGGRTAADSSGRTDSTPAPLPQPLPLEGLYCPCCGRPVPTADRSRQVPAWCDFCRRTF